MATILDLLNAPEFAERRLTEAINIPPYETGRPAQLGIFADTPIGTTYVKIAIKDGEITIIPSVERGGPSNKNMSGDRAETLIPVPHFPLDDAITPSDLQNIMVYGDEGYALLRLTQVVNDKLTEMRSKHDATHNHLDWGALNGLIIDAKGKQLVDLYSAFDITKQMVSFGLNSDASDVAAKNGEVKSLIRKALRGSPSNKVRILAGAEWFEKYVGHKSVKESMKYYPGPTPNPARDDVTDEFPYRGLTVERVDEEFAVRLPNGTLEYRPAVASNKAIALPLGTPFFKRYIAPPDTIQNANTAPQPGDKIFVSTDTRPHGKGEDVHTESNVLPVCLRPDLIIECTL